MNDCTVAELLNGPRLPHVGIVHGCGDMYTKTQQAAVSARVQSLIGSIQKANPATVIIISPINPESSIGLIEHRTQTLCDQSTVLLIVTPRATKVGKWYKNGNRLGDTVK